jgi:hypothetical protein
MAGDFPKMYYKDYPVYAVAINSEEAKVLEKEGYSTERWPPNEMKEKPNEPNSK